MIELPRATVTRGEIAEAAEFFSFGTNDLTQTAFGFSRDDIGKFVGMYEERKLVPANPFVTIDQPGVGRLMRIAVEEGRAANASLHVGICGEHGGDPASVAFCHQLGLDYVSCSPFRVETARLAAGQAAVGSAESVDVTDLDGLEELLYLVEGLWPVRTSTISQAKVTRYRRPRSGARSPRAGDGCPTRDRGRHCGGGRRRHRGVLLDAE